MNVSRPARSSAATRQPIPAAVLADLCGRLATVLAAGIDLRKAWAGESLRVPVRWRPAMQAVAEGLAAGEPLSDAVRRAGAAFPPLLIGMLTVGDRTGRDVEVLKETARVLDHAVRTARQLRSSLVWPVFQLIVALGVVGLLILVAGVMRTAEGGAIDLLGIGLAGIRGLVIYLGIVAAVVTALFVGGRWAVANWRAHGLVRSIMDWVPIMGPAARAAEAAAWCRAAGLAAGAGLDAGRLVDLASSVAPGLAVDRGWLEERLRHGDTLADALRVSGRFSDTLCEGVALGEQTGNTAEVLARLATGFDEQARAGLEAAARFCGGAVWTAVAVLIVMVIYRIFSFYVGMIQAAANSI
jgi:type II secretory pathway component PulF